MSFNLRKMELNDVDAVYKIERESFSTPWSKQSLQEEIENSKLSYYYVCEDILSGEIVGYFGLWIIYDEAYINNIAVASGYRGRGIGTFLIEKIIKLCEERELTGVTLEARKSNDTAINLYKKSGFEVKGLRKNFYEREKEDAIIMWKYFR